jgi:hypothetical protein
MDPDPDSQPWERKCFESIPLSKGRAVSSTSPPVLYLDEPCDFFCFFGGDATVKYCSQYQIAKIAYVSPTDGNVTTNHNILKIKKFKCKTFNQIKLSLRKLSNYKLVTM